jgi:hypothetical protein
VDVERDRVSDFDLRAGKADEAIPPVRPFLGIRMKPGSSDQIARAAPSRVSG